MKRTCLLLVGARMACLRLNLMNWQELGILQNTSSGFWVEVECLFYSIKHVSSFFRENISYWKVKEIDPQEQRAKGYCPLTPKEVGIFLSSLGSPSNTPIYVAAGAIYGGGSHLSDLESRFPILLSKV